MLLAHAVIAVPGPQRSGSPRYRSGAKAYPYGRKSCRKIAPHADPHLLEAEKKNPHNYPLTRRPDLLTEGRVDHCVFRLGGGEFVSEKLLPPFVEFSARQRAAQTGKDGMTYSLRRPLIEACVLRRRTYSERGHRQITPPRETEGERQTERDDGWKHWGKRAIQ